MIYDEAVQIECQKFLIKLLKFPSKPDIYHNFNKDGCKQFRFLNDFQNISRLVYSLYVSGNYSNNICILDSILCLENIYWIKVLGLHQIHLVLYIYCVNWTYMLCFSGTNHVRVLNVANECRIVTLCVSSLQ